MGIGAGLYMYVVVVQKFTFAISSPDEFLFVLLCSMCVCFMFYVRTLIAFSQIMVDAAVCFLVGCVYVLSFLFTCLL